MRELRHVPPLKRPKFAIIGRMQTSKHGKLISKEKRFSDVNSRFDAISKLIRLKQEPEYKRWRFQTIVIKEDKR